MKIKQLFTFLLVFVIVGTVIPCASATTKITAYGISTPYTLDVRVFGATGNGVTDDTNAIRAAITAASNTNGQLYIPPGNYLISSTLTIPGYMRVYGARSSVLILKSGSNCPMIQTANDGVQKMNVVLDGFSLDGQAASQSGSSPTIDIYCTNNVIISNMYIQNSRGSAIRVGYSGTQYCLNPMIYDCKIQGDQYNSQANGIEIDYLATDSYLVSNDIGWFENGAGILYSGGNDHDCIGCKTWMCKQGIECYGTENTRIIGGFGNNCKYYGLAIYNSNHITASGFQSVTNSQQTSGTYEGIHVEGVSGTPSSDIILDCCSSYGSSQKYGLAFGSGTYGYVQNVQVSGGDFSGNNAGPFGGINTNNANINIQNVLGFNPLGYSNTYQDAVPGTGYAYTNNKGFPCRVCVSGGTVSNIAIGGSSTGLTSGMFIVEPGETITLTYSAAPTWKWFGM